MLVVGKSYYIINAFISIYILLFMVLRAPELIAASANEAMPPAMIVIVVIAAITLFTNPSPTLSQWIRKLGLIIIVTVQLKSEIDAGLERFGPPQQDLKGVVTVVTGATAGIGFGIAEYFAKLNATVVIGCRNETACSRTASRILELVEQDNKKRHITTALDNVIPMSLDLADLNSVQSFSKAVKKKYPRIDVLVNNAGLAGPAGRKTAQGLEESIGVMHVGHFALTEWLLDALRKPQPKNREGLASARVINVASLAYAAGRFHPSLMNDSGTGDFQGEITDNCPVIHLLDVIPVFCCPMMSCPFTNGYARAKLANVLQTFELQRRLDVNSGANSKQRRVVVSSLHPGTVSSEIHPFLKHPLIAPLLRKPDEAANIVLRATLYDNFVPSAFFDSMGYTHDFFDYRDKHLPVHLEAYPATSVLPLYNPAKMRKRQTFEDWLWNRISSIILSDMKDGSDVNVTMETVSARLYDVSRQVIINFEKKRPLFSTAISDSTNKL